jgi:LysR family transcriptional regulator for metE and metH
MTSEVTDSRLRAGRLFRDEQVALVAPQHPWAARRSIRPLDFAAEHLILYNVHRSTSDVFRRILAPEAVEPARVSAVPLTEAIVELVGAGLGVGLLSRWSVAPALESGKVVAVRIGPRGVYRSWSAVTLRGRQDPEWLKPFLDLVRAHALPVRATGRQVP